MQEKNNKGVAGQLHLNKISANRSLIPTKPGATQAVGKPMPIVKYINTMNRLYGNSNTDEYGNEERATDRIQEQDRQQKAKEPVAKKAPKMSATRSWQIIRDSMSKDELEEHYKEHPKERPVKLAPVKLDQGLTDMLGDEDWLL